MKIYVAYIRVSTDRQGHSGLGLEAQREAVSRFIGSTGRLLGKFREVESGRRHKNRPQLLAALEQCKKLRATLVIAKLDRLGRNVAFISALMESSVEFVCCDNPHATRLMLHLLAAFDEHEREVISHRTKAALAQVKLELRQKGSRVSHAGRVYTKLGRSDPLAALRIANLARNLRPPPPNVIRFMHELRGRGESYGAIARELNAHRVHTPQGSAWYASTVRAALLRNSPTTTSPEDAMTKARYDGIAASPFSDAALSSGLKASAEPGIPFCASPSAGRGLAKKEGMPMPSDIKEAEKMLGLFTSVGARSFRVSVVDINRNCRWSKDYSPSELRDKLPAAVRVAAQRRLYTLKDGRKVEAGESVIIRPAGPDFALIQLDDVKDSSLTASIQRPSLFRPPVPATTRHG